MEVKQNKNAFPHGVSAEPVLIDGEWYLPTLPTSGLRWSLIREVGDTDYGFISKEYLFIDTPPTTSLHKSQDAFITVSGHEDVRFHLSGDPEGCHEYPPYIAWLYRPVLIPLEKDGSVSSAFKQYQNGEILRFGTFHMNGDIYHPRTLMNIYTKNHTNKEFLFADSDGKNDLIWMCWHGLLICCDSVASIYPPILLEMDFTTSYDWLMVTMNIPDN